MEIQKITKFFGILIGIAVGVLWKQPHLYNYSRFLTSVCNVGKPASPIIAGGYNDNLYTRGRIHYLSMDSGMRDCWNSTIKPLLQLACPDMVTRSDIELELAFVMTSCFCESIGEPKLDCSEDREHCRDKRTYHADAELILCAQGKCFNQWKHDGFDTIYKKMPALCYFYQYESQFRDHKMIPFISDELLQQVLQEVKGTSATYWPDLPFLNRLVTSEMDSRKSALKRRLAKGWTELQLVLGDLKWQITMMVEEAGEMLRDFYYSFLGFFSYIEDEI